MVQIIQARQQQPKPPSFGERVSAGIGRGIETASQLREEAKLKEREEKRKLAVKHLAGAGNEHIADLDPDLQKIYFTKEFERKNKAHELSGGDVEDKKSYDIIANRFGVENADLWKSAPEGGKTKLLQNLLENEQRGITLPNQLPTQQKNTSPTEGEAPKSNAIDYDKGLTPKERNQRQNARYEKALPLQQASQQKLHSYDSMNEEIGILQELSPQISGWERLNINPLTGDLIIPALASPEAQQFVKTVNDFTIQAKDSYGTRVTNFDLNQFMRRLPTLANTSEGRERILSQMKVINNLNTMYERSIRDVLEEHGGIRNIDYDRATDIAYKRFEKDSKPLKAELKSLASGDNREFKHMISEKKRKAPPGQVLMMTKEGTFGYVNEKEVSEALKDELTIP